MAARTARARAGDDGGDDRSSTRINGRSERRGDRWAVGSAPSSSSSSPFFFFFFLPPPFFHLPPLLLAGGGRSPAAEPRAAGLVEDGRRGGAVWPPWPVRLGRWGQAGPPAGPSATGVVGAGPWPRGHRIRAGAPTGRRGERHRAWARLARALGHRCRRNVVAGTGRQSKARARRGRGAGAAEREGGGGGARRRRLRTAGAGSVCWNRLRLGRAGLFSHGPLPGDR